VSKQSTVVMKHLAYLCLLLATVGVASGFFHKLFKKKEECDIIWEEHTQPHCSTSYEKHCVTEYSDKCHTEYTTECKPTYEKQCKTQYERVCKEENVKECTTEYVDKCETENIEECTTEYTEECWDEWDDVCHKHPECHTTYVDHCEPVFKKHCHGHGGKKKGKKWRRDVAEELVNEEDDEEEFDELKNMSTAEVLDILSDPQDDYVDHDSYGSSKQKRHIADKIHKFLKKGKKKEKCETIDAGEQCEKVPVENCHDVESCSKEIRRECKKVPHQKCWQEPHEKCWQVPHEKCWDEPHEKCWDEPHEKCWDEPSKVCTQVPWEKCSKEPYDHCTDHPKEYCEDVKVKVARRHCRQKDKKDKKKGAKFLEKLFKKDKSTGGSAYDIVDTVIGGY